MNDNVHTLGVVPVQAEIDEAVVRILEEALADAKAGKIDEVIVMSYRPGLEDPFDYHISPTRRLMAWIGNLEAIKLDWLQDATKERDRTNL